VTSDRSLLEILGDCMRANQPLPVPLALSILRQVCDQLEAALNMRDAAGQQLWIMHRDIAPANIFVANSGEVRLVASATPHGTPGYLPPEYVSAGMFDPRGDVFALGAVAHEMLTNRPLFWGSDVNDTFARVMGLAIAPPSAVNPQVPPELDGIVLMALGRDPQFRWQSIGMMRDGLLSVMERFGMFTPPPEPVVPAPAPPSITPPGHIPVSLIEPAPPVVADPLPQPAPSEQWCDDTDHETQISKIPDNVPELPVIRMSPSPRPTPNPPPETRRAPLEPFELPAPVPVQRAFARPGTPFPIKSDGPLELDFPEFTQIGEVPLIQESRETGGQPIVALVGEQPLRQKASNPTLPPPMVTVSGVSMPDDDDDKSSKKKLWLILGLGTAAVAGTIVMLVVLDVF
jgi:serine/threonine protein kinase